MFPDPRDLFTSLQDGAARIFLQFYALAGIQTHVSRIALTRDRWKAAQQTELPRSGIFQDLIRRKTLNFTVWAKLK